MENEKTIEEIVLYSGDKRMYDWYAYSNGIIIRYEDKTFTAYPEKGKSKQLYKGKWDSWDTYNDGLIIDDGGSCTAYPINGKPKQLYKEKYETPRSFSCSRTYRDGVIREREREKENNTYTVYPINGKPKQLYKGGCKDYRTYDNGIIINKDGAHTVYPINGKPKQLYKEKSDSWDVGGTYNNGLIIKKKNTFTAYPINGKPKQLYKEKSGDWQPFLKGWQACDNGVIIYEYDGWRTGENRSLTLYPINGKPKQLWKGEWFDKWAPYNNGVVIRNNNTWKAYKIKTQR